MDHPIVHAKTIFNRIKEAHLDQRGDSLAASSLPLKKKLDFLYRIADQHTVFRVMAGAMTPEPDGQHFRSRAELADEASRLDVGEVVDVQIEVGHGDTFRIEVVDGLEDKSAGKVRKVLSMSPRIVLKRNLSMSVGMGLMAGRRASLETDLSMNLRLTLMVSLRIRIWMSRTWRFVVKPMRKIIMAWAISPLR